MASPTGYEWFLRAELMRALGDDAAAAQAYDMARGQAQPAQASRGLAGAVGALGLSQTEDPLLLARLADALDRAGRPDAAADALQEAEAQGSTAEVWLSRGRIAVRHGDDDAAASHFRRAIAADPNLAAARQALASLLRRTGHAPRAAAVETELPGTPRVDLWKHLREPDRNAPSQAAIALERALEDAQAASLAGDAAPDVRTIEAAVDRMLSSGHPATAIRVLRAEPVERRNPAQWLQALLAAHRVAVAEAWMLAYPPDALGGPARLATAWLLLDRPQRAEALCELSLLRDASDHRARTLQAQAALAQGAWLRAARLAAGVPAASAHVDQARITLAASLRAAGLDAVGRELLDQ